MNVELAGRVRGAMGAVDALCPVRIRPTVVAMLMNLADMVEGGGSQSGRQEIRKTVGGQLAKVWYEGFLLPLGHKRNELHHHIRRAIPTWQPPETTERVRDAVKAARDELQAGWPIASHVDAGLAYLDAVDVFLAAVNFVSVSATDVERRKLTWGRYVDLSAPPHKVQSALPHAFRFGLLRALRARRAESPALRAALAEDRFGFEAADLGRGAMPLVAEIAARFPGARFDALDVAVEDGRMVLVPVFADGDMAVRLPMTHAAGTPLHGPSGGLVRQTGASWRYAAAQSLPGRIAADAPDSTRAMLDLWRVLSRSPASEAFAFCILGTRHILVAPRLGRRSPPPNMLGLVVETVAGRDIDLSLGLGSVISIEEARSVGTWTVDAELHIARLVAPA